MFDVRSILTELLKQIDISDQYAADAKEPGDRVPSVWQLQNGLIRDKAREALDSATSKIT